MGVEIRVSIVSRCQLLSLLTWFHLFRIRSAFIEYFDSQTCNLIMDVLRKWLS